MSGSAGDKGMMASLQKQLAEVQQQKALLERKHADLQVGGTACSSR